MNEIGLTNIKPTVANWYHFDTLTESPSQINFQIFSAVLSILSIAYLEGSQRFFPRGQLEQNKSIFRRRKKKKDCPVDM